MTITIRATQAEDWREVRDLRLEMLADQPMAFAESLQDALKLTEQDWRLRGACGQADNGTSLVAVTGEGRWIGGMGCFFVEGQEPLLVGVYVAPEYRGAMHGVADALLEAIKAWAGAWGSLLRLDVHEDNLRARRFYLRRGFSFTGATKPYNLNPAQIELEMACPLR